DATRALAGDLDEQRHERDVVQVPGPEGPALVAWAEADPLVAGHDHERAVPQPRRAQALDEPAEQPVRVGELQQMTLPVLDDDARILRPDLVGRPRRHGVAHRIALARGPVLPRAVWQEEVQVRQRRARRARQRLQEAVEARWLVAAGVEEVLPALRDGGEVVRELPREQQVA